MSWHVTLDPTAIVPARTELDLNSGGIQVSNAGIDWGETAIKDFLAEQQYGERTVSYRVPNRQVSIPLGLGMGPGALEEQEISRRKLEQKVGLLQRHGGVLLRQRVPGGEPLYADIVNASLTVPDILGETGGVEPNTVLKLECLPDFYGESVELDAVSGTGNISAVLQQAKKPAVIAGDYPARVRVLVKSPVTQKGLIWGFRSTNYSSATTASLSYDAYLLTLINNTVSAAQPSEPTYHSYSGKIAQLKEPIVNTWHPMLETTVASGTAHLTHVGTYRVWVRAAAWPGSKLRLVWGNDGATSPTYNTPVTLPGGYALLDLGEIRIEEPPVGEHWWRGVIQVETGAVTHETWLDRIWFQPLDDTAGKLRATASSSSALLSDAENRPTVAEESGTGKAWKEKEQFVKTISSGASVVLATAGEKSKLLKGTTLAVGIPTGAVVKGIAVRLSANAGGGVGGHSPKNPPNMALYLYRGATESAPKELLKEAHTYGGPTDLWGLTWTAAQINEAPFAVAVIIECTESEVSGEKQHAEVFCPAVTVYYNLAGGVTAEDAVVYAERKLEVRFDGSYREDEGTEAYARISEETGDLARMPPSGIENKEVQLWLKPTRGLFDDVDPGIDAVTAQVIYRPCYIGRI